MLKGKELYKLFVNIKMCNSKNFYSILKMNILNILMYLQKNAISNIVVSYKYYIYNRFKMYNKICMGKTFLKLF